MEILKADKETSGHHSSIVARLAAVSGLCWMMLACPALGQKRDLTPTERKTILEEIEKVESKLTDSRMRNNLRVLSKLREASASPQAALKYYLIALKGTDWVAKGKRESDWKEWRDDQDEFKDSGYGKARQYQLRYLMLTIRAAILEDKDEAGTSKMLGELVDFLNDVVENYEDIVNHAAVLRSSVLSGTFAEYTKLDLTLDNPKLWAEAPLSVNSVYEGTVLPFYRKTGNATGLRKAWESRISQLTKLAGTEEKVKVSNRSKRGAFGADKSVEGRGGTADRDKVKEERKKNAEEAAERLAEFKNQDLPILQWEMERDSFVFGNNRAAAAKRISNHIEDHLDHPRAPNWIVEFKKLASGDFEIEDYLPEEQAGDSIDKDGE